ncbi:MAG: hypothetical protein WAT12_02195 [Candidatus Nitrotoga sp.]
MSSACSYNRAALLRDALHALKAQQPVARQKWEVIMSDCIFILPALLPIHIHNLLIQMLKNSREKTSQITVSRK